MMNLVKMLNWWLNGNESLKNQNEIHVDVDFRTIQSINRIVHIHVCSKNVLLNVNIEYINQNPE